MTSTQLCAEELAQPNISVVDAHCHNENPEDIGKAIDRSDEIIAWTVPARDVLLRCARPTSTSLDERGRAVARLW
jgi:hypothetical protein